jgi:hypothetical protein
MKEEIRELSKLNRIIADIVDSFQPNRVVSPYPDDTYLFSSTKVKLRPVEEIDLSNSPLETRFYVHGQHSRASYWLGRLFEQDGQRQVDVWRNLDCDGLRATIDKVISVAIKDGPLWIVEKGILRKGLNSAFPYFDYERDSNGKLVVCKPETEWLDSYEKLWIVEK